MTFDVGIIGGGVIGLSCAWRLAQAGAKVAVFERGEIGREASWAAAGMLAAQCEAAHHPPAESGSIEYSNNAAMLDLCLQSRAMYADFAEELFDATGIDIELSISGHNHNDWRAPGISYVQTQSDDAAFSRFSQTHESAQIGENAPDFNGFRAVNLPREGSVHTRRLVEALEIAAKKSGVVIHENSAASLTNDGKNFTISGENGATNCDRVLVCAGAWSSAFLPSIPVFPVAGEMLLLRTEWPHGVIYASDVYLVPRRDGTLLVGATVEPNRTDKTVTAEGARQLLEAACRVAPQLKGAALIDSWAGLRPGTPDGLPILGKTPLENLFVATGHYRNGILLAPVTAKLMADCILNGNDAPAAFGIARFAS